ncbi:glycosyltransferase [Luteimonas sp. 50]|uniref:Glycosyltransferase n=1 Tax=Cognatiluteimonas sedimenti TaxID=2927791 RepID=A0ABT0A415_9GAMM|nr:glycosyltransferase [Lysobacter sedimenti]MCJ0825712.1 glycosyltransferase [Lysobacter sedimenti]
MSARAASAPPGHPGGAKPKVCFVLAYRAPDYIRGRALCAALAGSGAVDLWLAVNRTKGIRRYWQSIRQLLHVRSNFDPDVYILGFRGHEIAWLVRWLTRDRQLVLDALMSPYAAMKEEGKLGLLGRVLAPCWRRYEGAILHLADAVLADTHLQAAYYRDEFRLPVDKVIAIPVGAIERAGDPAIPPSTASHGPLRVLFYGSFLPLHGMDVILDAAASLSDLPIEFDFIGGSRAQARQFRAACNTRGIQRYTHRRWVPLEHLLQHEIPGADLCLGGPFGGTPQARRVVTGKASQCMASGKATVIGRIDEDYGFIDRDNCLLVEQGNAAALAEAIRWAHDHRAELPAIGRRGRALYEQRLSGRVIGDRLLPLVRQLAARHATRRLA